MYLGTTQLVKPKRLRRKLGLKEQHRVQCPKMSPIYHVSDRYAQTTSQTDNKYTSQKLCMSYNEWEEMGWGLHPQRVLPFINRDCDGSTEVVGCIDERLANMYVPS